MIRHAILAILGLALAACGDDKRSPIVYPPQPPGPPPPAPVTPGIQPIAVPQCPQTTIGVDGWVVTCGSPATPLVMGGAPGAAVLDIPADGNGVHYVIRANAWGPLSGRTMVMRYSVDGDCQLQAKGDGTYDAGEPMLTLYIQQGPQLNNNEDSRWWGGTARGKLFENGSYEMRLTVAPEGWSNIMGHGGVGREGQFTAAANSATYVGFTAGGGYFGHGVWCNPGGTKRIVVTDYHVE
jgi:hypothetical protein